MTVLFGEFLQHCLVLLFGFLCLWYLVVVVVVVVAAAVSFLYVFVKTQFMSYVLNIGLWYFCN